MNNHLIILTGNIGTGKSTLAKEYVKKGYYVISRDALRYMIGGGNYRFEEENEPLIHESEIAILEAYMCSVMPIIVDEVGINKLSRRKYIALAKFYNYKITVIVLPKISLKETLRRKLKVTHGQGSNVWTMVYNKFKKQYEKPTIKEGIDEIIWR